MAVRGYADGMQGGMVIGLPPILNFGTPEMKKAIVPDILNGKKFISLAISEAFAGSDVAGLRYVYHPIPVNGLSLTVRCRCTATKTADGNHFIINGTKKCVDFQLYLVHATNLTNH